MAKVQVETCSSHVNVRVWIKINSSCARLNKCSLHTEITLFTQILMEFNCIWFHNFQCIQNVNMLKIAATAAATTTTITTATIINTNSIISSTLRRRIKLYWLYAYTKFHGTSSDGSNVISWMNIRHDNRLTLTLLRLKFTHIFHVLHSLHYNSITFI